jgi:hypothetical protein
LKRAGRQVRAPYGLDGNPTEAAGCFIDGMKRKDGARTTIEMKDDVEYEVSAKSRSV